jgi:hypothetical protein
MEQHPIIGRTLDGAGHIYTRTIVLWAVGININTEELWDNVDVTMTRNVPTTHSMSYSIMQRMQPRPAMAPDAPKKRKCDEALIAPAPEAISVPVIRMMSTSTHRKGDLLKRLRNNPFRSVLSMDVEYKGYMPNLKISNRNTIQATVHGHNSIGFFSV